MDASFSIERSKATQLEAWPVVLSLLFDLTGSSDHVIAIVERSGLNVDWNLTTKEAFSHTTRKRAYRPRIQTAYSNLPLGDRQTIMSLISAEVATKYPAHTDAIRNALSRIGWTLKAVDDSQQQREEESLSMKRDTELQRLLLLQVRDGKEPQGLSNYPEPQQIYNSALLINDGYVEGEAIRGGSGAYVTTVMTALTSKGHDFLDAGEKKSEVQRTAVTPENSAEKVPKSSKLIFVSHSSADDDLATALVDMLCTALHLRVGDFLCTSVDGAKLRGGDDTDDVLRHQIRELPAFLSLLTPKAVTSTYVLFELGARWGSEKHHIPLLAKGAGSEVLKEPLKATNALRLSKEADVLQLVDDLGNVLNRTPEPASSYHQKMLTVVERAQLKTPPVSIASENPWLSGLNSMLKNIDAGPDLAVPRSLSAEAKTLLIEAAASPDGFVNKTSTSMYGEFVAVSTRNLNYKIEDPRARALWLAALNELVQAGYLTSGASGKVFSVSHAGYQTADLLKKQTQN